ncbi:ead/Ea22-like family protein [Enterobacter asburiae]|uniref:ead/Ea22-like family protein n=1 Tax=Enterobacter asburiae TaxID=61645 RepID=UPI0014333E7F|nr:ead/Ea22-like family protein [Enterobacter asburiae]NKD19379.1 ead/Ea22-like family protein [Enterobacter asburiae]
MSNIDKRALREAANAANAASWGNWEPYKPHKGARGYEVKVGVKAVAEHCLKVDSVFIAAANPATVLALLDELDKWQQESSAWQAVTEKQLALAEDAEKRIAELEAKLDSADKLQDSAFRHGLQHGFSLGQTDNQAGFEECLSAYGTGKGE